MNVISTETLVRQLLELGVTPSGVLLVHTSFSKVKPVEGGPEGLILGIANCSWRARHAGHAKHEL